ncbi:hypothetical protein N7510_002182 [Penicillium lagena]|uniref:uncharacterized protein n=1 Tax=Penicillium lagena TaxID=94218 RepID=UPI002541D335|nr:uncharacterized protein N7510_002182 [Penicillium lagena]KAJ5625873.1 hypothetical protein N7510_002182 [Penicillium lagena]
MDPRFGTRNSFSSTVILYSSVSPNQTTAEAILILNYIVGVEAMRGSQARRALIRAISRDSKRSPIT